MISAKERRDIANKLRNLSSNMSDVYKEFDGMGIDITCYEKTDYYQIYLTIFGDFPSEYMYHYDYQEFHNRLADLIYPEYDETCTIIEDDDGNHVCSKCGSKYFFISDAMYCQNCEAMVVSDKNSNVAV